MSPSRIWLPWCRGSAFPGPTCLSRRGDSSADFLLVPLTIFRYGSSRIGSPHSRTGRVVELILARRPEGTDRAGAASAKTMVLAGSRVGLNSPPQESLTLRGRAFSAEDLRTIRSIIRQSPSAHRFELSKLICRELDWVQPNGRLKDRSCRDVLAHLEELGLIKLPARRRPTVCRRPIDLTPRTAPRTALTVPPREVDLDCFSIVTGSGERGQDRLWNEYVERYHPLGYGVPLGAHIKYCVRWRGEVVSCLAFGGAAWKLEARDRWIGWNPEQRQCNLQRIVNNTRFLILPWARRPNLASRLLGLVARRLRGDWDRLYAYRPVLLETFVDMAQHTGTCYRAANWLYLGQTKGRGRMDRHFRADQPKKRVLVYPLVKDARTILCQGEDRVRLAR